MAAPHLNATSTAASDTLAGWTLESPGRGTLSLLASCIATTALCTWIVIHPRIYRRKKCRLPHKLALWLKTVIAPEFIAIEAAQEWTQAWKIVRHSAHLTNGELHLIHAFYLGMFGLQYRTENGTRVLWPNQFIWLLEERLLDWNDHREWGLSSANIEDKGNSDAVAKLFALVQAAWFVAQPIMRVAHDLPLAPLESMTLSYIPLFAAGYLYWWRKPKDIDTPSDITLPSMTEDQKHELFSLALHHRFDNEGLPEQNSMWAVWALTPRIFEREAQDKMFQDESQAYTIRMASFEKHIAGCSAAACAEELHVEPTKPFWRRETTLSRWDPELYHSNIMFPLCCLAGISFPALHLISWNSTFPTLIETWLWRASTLASMAATLVFMQFEKTVVRWDSIMIIKAFLPMVYLVTRVVLLAGAFAAFRGMDPAVYDTYVASSYWAHIM